MGAHPLVVRVTDTADPRAADQGAGQSAGLRRVLRGGVVNMAGAVVGAGLNLALIVAITRAFSQETAGLLFSATSVFLIAAVVFVVLWSQASGEADDLAATVKDRDGTIEDLEASVEQLETDLALAEGDAENAEGLQDCMDSLGAFFDAGEAGASDSELDVLWSDFNRTCAPYL